MSTLREKYLGNNNNSSLREKYNIKSIEKKEDNDNSLKEDVFSDGYQFGDITKTVLGTAKDVIPRIAKSTFEAGQEVVKHPINSAKTLFVSTAEGVNKADDALNNATGDFFNWLLKRDKKEGNLSVKDYNRLVNNGTKQEKEEALKKIEKLYGKNSDNYNFYKKAFNAKDDKDELTKKINDIVNPKYYNTETYKKYENNELSENQKKLWNIGENIGNMLPSMVVSSVAAPVAGSAMFYVQAQQNYTEEAKQRGYDNKKARIYGLIMGGVETGVERLGFDQLGGLGKLSEGNTLKAMGGEALEEFVTPYIDSIIKTKFGEKTNLSDTVEESIISAVYGGVIGGLINMGGKGLVAVDRVVNKINTNQQITNQELTQAVNDIKNQNPAYFEEIMQEVPEVIEIFKEQLEETKNNTTEDTTISQIDETIKNIDNEITSDTNNTSVINEIAEITNQLEEFQNIQNQNKLTKAQEQQMTELQERLNELQNTLDSQEPTINNNTPMTVNDVVAQENTRTISNINLPNLNTNSNGLNLPTVNDLVKSNTNTNYSSVNASIPPQTIAKIKAIQNNKNPNVKYTPKHIAAILRESNIEVPSSFSYVKNINSDLTYTTTRELTPQQRTLIENALNQLKSVDANSINNTNMIAPSSSNIRFTEGNIPINQSNVANATISDNLLAFDKKTIYDIMRGKNNVIVNSKEELKNYVIEALEEPNSNRNLHLGVIPSDTISRIKNEVTQISQEKIDNILKDDVNYDLAVNQKEIRHLKKESLSVDDVVEFIDTLDELIVNFDSVMYTVYSGNQNALRFKKNMSDGTHIALEVISNKKNTMRTHTLFLDGADFRNKKRSLSPTLNEFKNSLSKTSEMDGALASYDNNIPQPNNNVKSDILPTTNNMQNSSKNTNKINNPNEISKLTKEDATTTPILPTKNVSTGKGKSHFVHNIEVKTNMLTQESKNTILSENEVNYYKEVSNKESLEKAFDRLNKGGKIETQNWLRKESANTDSTDVAEGWILLKQYQDEIAKETDLIKKDEINRSMVQVAKKMREMGTKAGQTVQAYNILNRLTPEGMVYYAQSELSEAFDKMTKNKTKEWIDSHREDFELTPRETDFIMKTMQEIQQMEDGYDKRVKLAEIQKMMTDKLPPAKGAGIKAWMRISMLFNPKTQVRNVMGNAVITPVNIFSDLFASVVDKKISKTTGKRTTGTINAKEYAKGFKKGAFQSYNDFKKGINTRNIEGNRFEIGDGKSFDDTSVSGKALNKVDSLLSFMLDAGDRTFYEASFTNSINNQLILNNTDIVTQDMIDIATSEALSRTWQDNNNYTEFVLNVRKSLNKINVGGYGFGDILIPFAKTPANLTKAIVDYSPLGLISTINKGLNLKKSLTNGQYTPKMQHDFVQSLGKATAGSMLYILGIALAKAGVTSGDSDDDKDVANFMKNTLGVSSYSVKIGGKTFTYDWAQPIAAPFAMTANLVNKQKEGAELKENITTTLDTGLNVLFEQSFLESLSNVLSEPGEIGTKIQEQLLDLPARAIPTLSKQIADLIDGTQRTSFEYNKPLETALNKVKAKLPVVSTTLSPSIDTLGREIKKYGGKNNIFNVFLNPANVNTENLSKSAEEIYRLYKATGDKTIMPRVAPYYINQNGEKVTMTSQERTEYQKISGEIIEDNIKRLIKDNKYKNLDDEEKASVIKQIVDFSYNKAKSEVLDIPISNTYNKIDKYIDDGGTAAKYYMNKEEIDYSYNNPEKYKTISQIATYDDYITYQKGIDEVKEDYDNTNQRKYAVINYVNSLDLSIPQKAILIKMNYSSFNSYDNDIIEYINNQELSIEDKIDILTKLGFKVRNGRVYTK